MTHRSHALLCRTCHYWQHVIFEEGMCRRHAPAPSHRQFPAFAFPTMYEDQWCGDHFYVGDQKPAVDKRGLPFGAHQERPEPEPWAPDEGVIAKLMLGPGYKQSYPWADSLDEPETGLDV